MLKKSQWVQFTNKAKETVTAFVTKGGVNPTVAYNQTVETYRQAKAHHSLFTVIPEPNLDISGIMDAYELKAYKEAGGEETIRFEAKLYKNGKHIAMVSNGGYGGCNDYHHVGDNRENLTEFDADVKRWAIHYGDKNPFEPESNWISWVYMKKDMGISAKAYWEYHHEYMNR
ncbi:MAG TPA: hypothetical protein DCW93_04590 [Saprospirales bacterium]|nr:hypothetical protein [Saprospirales bacterium]